MPTFKEIFSKLAAASPGDFHAPDEFTRVYLDDVMLQIQVDEEDGGSFDEEWVRRFPDPRGFRYEVHVLYGGSRLHTFLFVSVDGGRYMLPLPTSAPQLEIDTLQFTLARVLQNSSHSVDEGINRAGIKVVQTHRNSLKY